MRRSSHGQREDGSELWSLGDLGAPIRVAPAGSHSLANSWRASHSPEDPTGRLVGFPVGIHRSLCAVGRLLEGLPGAGEGVGGRWTEGAVEVRAGRGLELPMPT